MQPPLHIVWFKRDLRIADHRPLVEAARRGAVLPLYIVEPELWREADASGRHWQFVAECLRELDHDLGALGQPLIVRIGDAVGVLEALRQQQPIAALWSHEETGNGWTYARDRAVGAWARTHGIPWHEARQTGVRRRLGSRDGWAKAWDQQMRQPVIAPPRALAPLTGLTRDPLPDARALGLADDPCPDRQIGGRGHGLALLETFLASRGRDYRRAMSTPLEGAVACSRVSAHLAFGSLALREVAQAGWQRLDGLGGARGAEAAAWRGAVSSFMGRLHWHCHFMQKLESEPAIEHRELHPATRGLRPEVADRSLIDAWSVGATGYPFLDACMRSLAATGWLNFRMRAMVMSFASYNLWLPWRETGLVLARRFTDYEPGIHWPQAQMQSGTTGINTIRIYSVVKQGYDQDPQGVFTRRWVPELADVPDRFVHEPWRWEGASGLIGRSYPERIVDLAASTAEAKARIYALRGGPAFRTAADAIQERHGSRKSGIPMTGARRKPAPVATERGAKASRRRAPNGDAERQLKFDL